MNRQFQFICNISLASVTFLLVAQPGWAEGKGNGTRAKGREVKEWRSQPPATTVKEWLAQVEATTVRITGVTLNRVNAGLEIVLATQDGKPLQVDASKFRTEGSSLIADIPKAVLALPEGQAFAAENPTADIARVQVVQQDASSIRISVIRNKALPKTDVTLKTGGLAYSLNPEGETPEEEVVVTGAGQRGYFVPDATTATRTDTPLRDVPQAIIVIPRQVIEDQQVVRLGEALQNVSGLTNSSTGEGFEIIRLRGFRDTPVLRDGFRQYGLFNSPSFPEPANLERIEVLKGPASILYGEIQPGGVINTVAKKPLPQPFYTAELQIGSRNLFRPRIDFSGPVTADGKLLYRLNALVSNDDGFRGFDTNFQRAFIAPTLTWKIGDRTDLTLQLDYLDFKQPLDDGRVAVGDRLARTPRDRNFGEPGDFTESKVLNVGYNLEHRFNDNWTFRNAFRFMSRILVQESAFPFSFDETTNTLNRTWYGEDADVKDYALQTNIVGKFATGSVKHTLLFGVDLSRTNETQLGGIDFFTPLPLDIFNPVYGLVARPDRKDIPVVFDAKFDTDRLGVYLQDQVALVDNFKLLAGIRYETVKQRSQTAPGFFGSGGDTTQTNDAFTPRVGLVYQPIPELSLYGSYSRSFVPNTATTVNGDPLEPEKGEGYEIGIKAELLKGSLFATLAYFDITKQNVATADPNFPFGSVATGEQRSRGVEFDLTGQILPGWNILASYSYIDAKVSQDNTIPIGNLLEDVPRNSASLWTTYQIQKGGLQGLGIGFGFNFVGERQGDLENSFEVDSYFLTNAAIFYRRNNWRFAINFKNIGNVDYEAGALSRTRTQIGEPFTVIGSVSVQF